jgi:hypothetical protein
LNNDELLNLYSLLNIIRINKSRKMSWTRQVSCMGEIGNAYKILSGSTLDEDREQ